ncbi:hypothetical protein [Bradyrhizobium sp. BRP56]|uniref:hypothetical protein n=1 Tax=Bradyrhizobium sp. BRP56 TaxID=2793819 RepID=UPI001CD3089D|nr:hypothetical protein [Bradyrhizobium sp. BRP56]MCA1401934.1 hypothetical protein [Bradyrhizobium sp. BRP56]
MQEAASAVDDSMGERVEVMPVRATRPNFPTEPLPANAVTVTAVFTNPAKDVLLGESHGRMHGGMQVSPIISTNQPTFAFRYGVLPWPIRQGYRVKRLCDGSTYEVKDVRDDSVSRIKCPVVQLGRAKESF